MLDFRELLCKTEIFILYFVKIHKSKLIFFFIFSWGKNRFLNLKFLVYSTFVIDIFIGDYFELNHHTPF